jgi:hypothetical protein
LSKGLRLFRRRQEFYLSNQFHARIVTYSHYIEKKEVGTSSPPQADGVSVPSYS